MAALTVRMIEAIKPRDKPFKGTIDRGLQLRVAPDGRSAAYQGSIGTCVWLL